MIWEEIRGRKKCKFYNNQVDVNLLSLYHPIFKKVEKCQTLRVIVSSFVSIGWRNSSFQPQCIEQK